MTVDTRQDESQVALIIPTYNAARNWPALREGIRRQRFSPQWVLIIDSSSSDGTETLSRDAGFQVVIIDQLDFHHGGTRQLAAEYVPEADILVYITQDAVLANSDALAALLRPFEDESVGAVYGRQLPREGASPIEAHARIFNYPPASEVRTKENSKHRGFKAIFFSNSFGAYRRKALQEIGGFPQDVNFGEDTVAAGRLLLAGWKIAYAADAQVYHSHAYTVPQEFRRYLQVGQLHSTHPWMIREFGGASGEGFRFIRSEFRYLARTAPHLIPSALIRAANKILGYQLGRGLLGNL
jgi:rhamnosyltransferase